MDQGMREDDENSTTESVVGDLTPVQPPKGQVAENRVINRTDLYWMLARAAQVRSILTMLFFIPWLMLVGGVGLGVLTLFPGIERAVIDCFTVPILFGGPMTLSTFITSRYCRPRVLCPYCKCSLWDCGTGNFKPRRMRVRDDVRACPGCGTPIV